MGLSDLFFDIILPKNLEDIDSTIKGMSSQIRTINGKVTDIGKELSELYDFTHLTVYPQVLTNKSDILSLNTTTIPGIKGRLTSLETALGTYSSSAFDSLKSRLDTVEKDTSKNVRDINDILTVKLPEMGGRIDSLEKGAESLSESISSLPSTLTGTYGFLTTASITGNSWISKLKSDGVFFKSDMDRWSGHVLALAKKNATDIVDEKLMDYPTRSAMETYVKSHVPTSTTLDKMIAFVNSLPSDVTDLNSWINRIDAEMNEVTAFMGTVYENIDDMVKDSIGGVLSDYYGSIASYFRQGLSIPSNVSSLSDYIQSVILSSSDSLLSNIFLSFQTSTSKSASVSSVVQISLKDILVETYTKYVEMDMRATFFDSVKDKLLFTDTLVTSTFNGSTRNYTIAEWIGKLSVLDDSVWNAATYLGKSFTDYLHTSEDIGSIVSQQVNSLFDEQINDRIYNYYNTTIKPAYTSVVNSDTGLTGFASDWLNQTLKTTDGKNISASIIADMSSFVSENVNRIDELVSDTPLAQNVEEFLAKFIVYHATIPVSFYATGSPQDYVHVTFQTLDEFDSYIDTIYAMKKWMYNYTDENGNPAYEVKTNKYVLGFNRFDKFVAYHDHNEGSGFGSTDKIAYKVLDGGTVDWDHPVRFASIWTAIVYSEPSSYISDCESRDTEGDCSNALDVIVFGDQVIIASDTFSDFEQQVRDFVGDNTLDVASIVQNSRLYYNHLGVPYFVFSNTYGDYIITEGLVDFDKYNDKKAFIDSLNSMPKPIDFHIDIPQRDSGVSFTDPSWSDFRYVIDSINTDNAKSVDDAIGNQMKIQYKPAPSCTLFPTIVFDKDVSENEAIQQLKSLVSDNIPTTLFGRIKNLFETDALYGTLLSAEKRFNMLQDSITGLRVYVAEQVVNLGKDIDAMIDPKELAESLSKFGTNINNIIDGKVSMLTGYIDDVKTRVGNLESVYLPLPDGVTSMKVWMEDIGTKVENFASQTLDSFTITGFSDSCKVSDIFSNIKHSYQEFKYRIEGKVLVDGTIAYFGITHFMDQLSTEFDMLKSSLSSFDIPTLSDIQNWISNHKPNVDGIVDDLKAKLSDPAQYVLGKLNLNSMYTDLVNLKNGMVTWVHDRWSSFMTNIHNNTHITYSDKLGHSYSDYIIKYNSTTGDISWGAGKRITVEHPAFVFGTLFKSVFNEFKAMLSSLATRIKNMFDKMVNVVKDVVTKSIDYINDKLTYAIDNVKQILNKIINFLAGLSEDGKQLVDSLGSPIGNLNSLSTATSSMSNHFGAIKNHFTSLGDTFDAIKDVLSVC